MHTLSSIQKKLTLATLLLVFCILPFGFVPNHEQTASIPLPEYTSAAAAPGDSTWESEIGIVFLKIGAGVTWLGGSALDYAFKAYVYDMGKDLRGTRDEDTLGFAIEQLWKIVRDFCNLIFIFGFIYVGVRLIIDPEGADAKRFLVRIIIGALLINFSLFFTKVIVEVSNQFAITIYDQVAVTVEGDTNNEAVTEKSIALPFLKTIGLTSVYKADGDINGDEFLGRVDSFWFFIMGMIMFFVLGFIFLSGAILLIVRYVTIILLLIASPLLFAARVFPQTEKYSTEMLGTLFKNSVFVSAYLFLLYVSMNVLKISFGDDPQTGGFATALTGDGDSFGIILKFIVAITLIVFSLKIAEDLGVKGASTAVSIGKKAANSTRQFTQRSAGNLTLGGAAFLGRRTLGRRAQTLADEDGFKDWAANSRFGRVALKTARAIGDASFDARNVGGVGAAVGIGAGRKGGYKTIQDETQTARKKFADSLDEIDDSDPQVRARKDEAKLAKDTLARERRQLERRLREATTEDERKDALGKLERYEKAATDAETLYQQEKKRRVLGTTFISDSEQSVNTLKGRVAEASVRKNKLTKEQADIEATIKEKESEPNTPVRNQELAALQQRKNEIVAEIQGTQNLLTQSESELATAQNQFNKSAYGILKDSLDNSTKAVDSMYTDYLRVVNTDPAQAARIKERLDIAMKTQLEAKENFEAHVRKEAGGYAQALESTTWASRLVGEAAEMERSAGAEIRKSYIKNIKKPANERQTDAIVNAVKSSAK